MRGKQINLEDIIITKYKMFLLDAWFIGKLHGTLMFTHYTPFTRAKVSLGWNE